MNAGAGLRWILLCATRHTHLLLIVSIGDGITPGRWLVEGGWFRKMLICQRSWMINSGMAGLCDCLGETSVSTI